MLNDIEFPVLSRVGSADQWDTLKNDLEDLVKMRKEEKIENLAKLKEKQEKDMADTISQLSNTVDEAENYLKMLNEGERNEINFFTLNAVVKYRSRWHKPKEVASYLIKKESLLQQKPIPVVCKRRKNGFKFDTATAEFILEDYICYDSELVIYSTQYFYQHKVFYRVEFSYYYDDESGNDKPKSVRFSFVKSNELLPILESNNAKAFNEKYPSIYKTLKLDSVFCDN